MLQERDGVRVVRGDSDRADDTEGQRGGHGDREGAEPAGGVIRFDAALLSREKLGGRQGQGYLDSGHKEIRLCDQGGRTVHIDWRRCKGI